MKRTLAIILFFFCNHFVQAQQRLVKELAEPFSIECTIKPGSTLPQKGTTAGVFEILDMQQLNRFPQKDTNLLTLHLIAYDTGTFRLSEILQGLEPSKDWLISINPPPENLVKAYAPVKEIEISLEEPSNYKNIIWLVLALLATALALYLIVRKRKPKPETTVPYVDENWQDKLYRLTEAWKKEQISSVELGEGLITVLHSRFKVSQKKSIRKLHKSILKEKPALNGNGLKEILAQTDAWRFGKQQAEKNTGTFAIDSIKKIVDSRT